MGRGGMHHNKTVDLLLTWIILAIVEARLHETFEGATHGIQIIPILITLS
jgi:hypothetical protein